MALAVHVIELPPHTSPADFQAMLSSQIVLTWGDAAIRGYLLAAPGYQKRGANIRPDRP